MRCRYFGLAFGLVALLPGGPASADKSLEKGAAITDPVALSKLDKVYGYGVGPLLAEREANDNPISNEDLFELPAFAPIKKILRKEFIDYFKQQADRGRKMGIGAGFDFRLFDYNMLFSDRARFALAGIVSRLDKTYKDPTTCGEIRFIYRLTYRAAVTPGADTMLSSRLPMTLNVVFNAKDRQDDFHSCSDIAKAWLGSAGFGETGDALAQKLIAENALLDRSSLGSVIRIETNLQISRAPASVVPDFGGDAEYLLKVFDYNTVSEKFEEGLLENQIDRQRLMSDAALRQDLIDWLLTPKQVENLDNGTIDIPKRFLAKSAISVTPGGFARSANHQFFGFVKANDVSGNSYLSDARLRAAIEGAKSAGLKLRNIKSPMGFEQRLSDISCTGCHQSRAIGGFHFLGTDWTFNIPANSIFVPGSAHFFGDQVRRKDILEALAAGEPADFSRGFSARPSPRANRGLIGTGFYNGWGAQCYTLSDSLSEPVDPSFKSWTCAEGLTCRVLMRTPASSRFGVCATKNQIGDPLEQGIVSWAGFSRDRYATIKPQKSSYPPRPPNPEREIASHQMYVDEDPSGEEILNRTGGFFGGMLRTRTCNSLSRYPGSACGRVASSGFNDCIIKYQKPLNVCLNETTVTAGLRKCDRNTPCRDDYICVATDTKDSGTCIPPYFVFQFRVDGHPVIPASVNETE